MAPADRIPVIDLAPLRSGAAEARRAVAAAIGAACADTGFFYLAGHGIAAAKLDGIFAAAERFFALPLDARMVEAIRSTPTETRGYVPLLSRFYGNTTAPDIVEAFKYQRELPPDDPDIVDGGRMHQRNKWPAGLPGWRETLLDWHGEMERLGRTLLRGFALALDLDEDHLLQFYRKPLTQVSLLHYPPQPATAPEGQYGIRPHADATAFTILLQDAVGGLQIERRGGGWIEAPPIDGTFVINIGDLMARWTNGRFASTPHRVLNRTGRERYSVPFFAIPDFDAVVSCLPGCAGPGDPPRFEPLQVGAFMLRKFSADWSKEAKA